VGRGEGGKQEGVMECRNRGGKKVKERQEEFSRGWGGVLQSQTVTALIGEEHGWGCQAGGRKTPVDSPISGGDIQVRPG
jgi:hypothetical protein